MREDKSSLYGVAGRGGKVTKRTTRRLPGRKGRAGEKPTYLAMKLRCTHFPFRRRASV